MCRFFEGEVAPVSCGIAEGPRFWLYGGVYGDVNQKIDYVFNIVLIDDLQILSRFANNKLNLDSKAIIKNDFNL